MTVVPANSAELLDKVFRLRFQVYCRERGFEDAADYPNGREQDGDDRRSLHSLVLDRATGSAVGTVRMILPRTGHDLPVLRLIGAARRPAADLPRATTGEVSRFAIAKAFRRQCEGDLCRHADPASATGGSRRAALPLLTFALVQAVMMMSLVGEITHIVAMMEPALLRLLARMGIVFHPIGEMVEHHGLRQPGWAAMAHLAERVRHCHPELWQLATAPGRTVSEPPALASA